MRMEKNIKLSSKTTIKEYQIMLQEMDKGKIADFIFLRLTERYLLPVENVPIKYKNGFSIMANSCLLIETYESFRQGWDDTFAQDRIPFESFFNREKLFNVFQDDSKEFYMNIRCGILHQGETKKGWKITRKETHPLFSPTEKKINANKFLKTLRVVLENYIALLKTSSWDDEIWIRCRDKMNFIINNSQKNL